MNKKSIIGIAIVLAIISLAGAYYHYHVEINVLQKNEWSLLSYKLLVFVPVFYFGSFWLLNIAASDRLGEIINLPEITIGCNKIINQRLVAKAFIISLIYIGFITFAWATISDAQFLLNKNT